MKWVVGWDTIPRNPDLPVDGCEFSNLGAAIDQYMGEVVASLQGIGTVDGQPVNKSVAALMHEFIDDAEETRAMYESYMFGGGRFAPARVLKTIVKGECGMAVHSLYAKEEE